MGQHIFQQMRGMAAGYPRRQHMAQRPAQVIDVTVAIQIQLQTDARHHRAVRRPDRVGVSIEQATEQLVTGTQNCRLDEARSVAGRRGTEPIPGNTRNGSA